MIGITGANGVLGRILSRKYSEKEVLYSCYDGDIRDFEQLAVWIEKNELTYIVHLASKVAVSDVESNLVEAYEVNVSGTINLMKAIEKSGRRVGLFYAGTSHIYKSSSFPIKEDDPKDPINSYGLTKYISELLLTDYGKRFPDFPLCIGRIFSFYHASQKPPFLYANLMKRFREEDLSKPFQLYGANSTRDFLNAEEVCDIIMKLVSLKYKGIVNIASGKSTKIIDFVQSVAPVKLAFQFDENEKVNHLNADITRLKEILNNYEE